MKEPVVVYGLRSFVERAEHLQREIDDLNNSKRDLFAEARSAGFDVKALKHVIANRAKDPAVLAEFDALVDLYMRALDDGQSRPNAHVQARKMVGLLFDEVEEQHRLHEQAHEEARP